MSATMPSPLSRWLMLQLTEGTLPAVVTAPLHSRVRNDPVWSGFYHAMRQTERGVGSAEQPAALSANQKAMLKQRLFDDPSLRQSTSTATASVTLGSGALAAACAGALVLVAQPAPPAPSRGDGVAPAEFIARGDDGLRLRVRCVLDGVVSADVEARENAIRVQCAAGGLLAIAVTNTSSVARHVAVEVVDVDGIDDRPLGGLVVPAGATNVLVPSGLRLDGRGERTLRLVDVDDGEVCSADVVVDAQ